MSSPHISPFCRLQEWSAKTPLVTRYAIFAVLPVSLISLLAGGAQYLALIPYDATVGVQLWRFFTCFLDQGGFFTLLFVVLMLATQMPAQEIREGSVPFLLRLFVQGSLINVLYVSLAVSIMRESKDIKSGGLDHCCSMVLTFFFSHLQTFSLPSFLVLSSIYISLFLCRCFSPSSHGPLSKCSPSCNRKDFGLS
jgi:membrane associated rhomboid family serine protease